MASRAAIRICGRLGIVLAIPCAAPLSAQSLAQVQPGAGWSETKRGEGTITYKTADGAAIVAIATGATPEQAARQMVAAAGIAGPITVQAKSGIAMAAQRAGAGKLILSLAQRGPQGKLGIVMQMVGASDPDTVSRTAAGMSQVLASLNGRGGAAPVANGAANGDTGPVDAAPPAGGSAPRPPGRTPPGLVGYWRADSVRNEYQYPGGLQLVAISEDYVFTPGGYFINGAPTGTGFGDAGAIATMRKNPADAGVVSVQPGQIQLRYANGKTKVLKYSGAGRDYRIVSDVGNMNRKIIAPDGFRLNGAWFNERNTDTGAGWVSGATYLNFSSDGHFVYSNGVSFSNAMMTSISRDPSSGGTYSIRDGALTLAFANGQRKVMSIFWESNPRSAMWLNNGIYKPAS